MILLDTNVISAMAHADGAPAVLAWLNRQDARDIWTTSVTVFEIELGIMTLPEGRKRAGLRQVWNDVLQLDLEGRVVDFDAAAARAAAFLAAARRRAGITVEIRDTQIAGIALARGATVATRNIRDFRDLDTPVIDPWAAAA